ncbi:MAG: hypothetical protein P8P74_17420 [Crocinitomicaceae bacterium]|nr:hypothetical protein [Crocinitomicaceae bacterium]
MKTLLLIVSFVGSLSLAFGQMIDDNKINFTFTQLPYIKVDNAFTNYDVKFVHGYEQSNQEIIAAHELNKKASMDMYMQSMIQYKRSTDSIDVAYFRRMATWEKDVNAGKTQPNGLALPQPIKPAYPVAPIFPAGLQEPRLNTPMDENIVLNRVNIAGFEKGMGGFVVTVNVLGLSNVQITSSKKGTGTSTKYTYTATYNLPVEITVESPTQGKLIFQRINTGRQSYAVGSYSSKYDYEVYMLTREDEFRRNLEVAARNKAATATNSFLNNQIGYVPKTRNAELYAVKKFKSYDYSDVTMAYTKTVQALMLVSQDRDRGSAMDKIEEALADWNMILEESNSYDKKARINDKITAMIQSNMAELLAWQGEYDKCDINVNLAISAGGKFKRHANAERGFYADQKKRWNIHY